MILLDTHIWVRWIEQETDPLPEAISNLIDESEQVAVSAISCWEVAYLEKRNRVVLSLSIGEWLREALEGSSILCLPLTANIAAKAAGLPDIHRDPADRFIIATALELNTKLITFDHLIKNYPELAGSLL